MSKKIQLQIPTPCHEDWDNMNPVDKGRFCSSCQKQVVDFSNMSDREVAMFFKKPSTGSVCGRFMQDQLDRDIDIPRKRIPWLKYFFQFALPAFLVSMKATAQGKVKVVEKQVVKTVQKKTCSATVGDVSMKVVNDSSILKPDITVITTLDITKQGKVLGYTASLNTLIKGKVINDKVEAIPFASVFIKNSHNGITADTNGCFSFGTNQYSKNDILVVSSVGFEAREISLANFQRLDSLTIQLKSKINLDSVIVTSDINTHRKGLVCCYKITKWKNFSTPGIDNVLPKFILYPNPVRSNSTLNIEWKQNEFGDHVLQLFNQSGQLVFTKDLYIDEEARVLSIDLPSVAPGSYFIRVSHKKSGKFYSEKIIVQ